MLFFNAIVIGFCIAAPVGPIGMLCIQRSLSRGFGAGLATGLGAACADAVYGLLGALGVAGILAALPSLALTLKIAGGVFLVWIAWSMARDARVMASAARDGTPRASRLREFGATFFLTLSNPMTIFSFLGIFAALGASLGGAAQASESAGRLASVVPLVAGVWLGSAAWWLLLSGLTAAVRKKMPARLTHSVALASALVIAVFGIAQWVEGLMRLARSA